MHLSDEKESVGHHDFDEKPRSTSTSISTPTLVTTTAAPTKETDGANFIPAGTPTITPNEDPLIDGIDHSLPPDGGYGWAVCAASGTINGFTWGIMACYGIYLSYYLDHNTFPGTKPISYAFIGGTNFATAMLISPVLQPLIRRVGTNTTIMLGCFIYAAGFIAASFAKTFWQLVLSQGICVGLGVGTIWQPSIPLLPQWFLRRRSLAQGIASCGAGIGGLIFSFATTPMIERLSLAWSLRITGIVSFVVLMCAACVVRDRNAFVRPRAVAFDTNLLKRYQVWLLLGWSVVNILGYMVLLYSLSSYATSIGLSQKQGGVVIALQNLGTALGRPFVGVLSDRYGRITVAMLLTVFTGIITFAIWIPAMSYGVLAFFGLLTGATLGTFWATIAPLSAEVVGLVDLPSMLSLAWIFISMPTLFSEAIALELRRPKTSASSRPYLYPQIYAGVCYLVAAGIMLELRRVKWGLWTRERHR